MVNKKSELTCRIPPVSFVATMSFFFEPQDALYEMIDAGLKPEPSDGPVV